MSNVQEANKTVRVSANENSIRLDEPTWTGDVVVEMKSAHVPAKDGSVMPRIRLSDLPTPEPVDQVLHQIKIVDPQILEEDLAELEVQLKLSYTYGGQCVLCVGRGVEMVVIAAGDISDMQRMFLAINDADACTAYFDFVVPWETLRDETLSFDHLVPNN